MLCPVPCAPCPVPCALPVPWDYLGALAYCSRAVGAPRGTWQVPPGAPTALGLPWGTWQVLPGAPTALGLPGSTCPLLPSRGSTSEHLAGASKHLVGAPRCSHGVFLKFWQSFFELADLIRRIELAELDRASIECLKSILGSRRRFCNPRSSSIELAELAELDFTCVFGRGLKLTLLRADRTYTIRGGLPSRSCATSNVDRPWDQGSAGLWEYQGTMAPPS